MTLPDGLVVIHADNSMGKSTCAKAILVALGMEAMLTTSRTDLPLTPALKFKLDSDNAQHVVLQSDVFLEIENQSGKRIVIQRTIKGSRSSDLVTVFDGPVLSVLGVPATSTEYALNVSGSARREFGFHFFLAQFLNWKLPAVQTYDGDPQPLYLQCIFPYFFVEQIRGWSSIQPPLPSHFRIRDTHKRAIEFILNLDAHKVALRRQELLLEKTKIESEWATRVFQLTEIADSIAGIVQGQPKTPVVAWPPVVTPLVSVPSGKDWIPLAVRISSRKSELAQLVEEEIPQVQDIASNLLDQLIEAESETRDKQVLLSRLLDALEMEQEEVTRLEHRLAAINEDIQRHKDVKTLKRLGARQNSTVDTGRCPVCHQDIHDSLFPLEIKQAVMTLDQNIAFLTEQKRTFEVVLENSRRLAEARATQVRSVNSELNAFRNAVRDLKQALVSDGRLPSIAAIRARIELEKVISQDAQSDQQFTAVLSKFGPLADRWKDVQTELDGLPKEDVTPDDKAKIAAWTVLLQSQLTQYGFKSVPINQVRISEDTYRPEHEGFDLQGTFALQSNISASDLVRTIWAFLQGLLELARTTVTNHPGCVVFDEPRQQSTADMSFGQLLQRSSAAGAANQQVIFFTSENIERLAQQLKDISHTLIAIEGRMIKAG